MDHPVADEPDAAEQVDAGVGSIGAAFGHPPPQPPQPRRPHVMGDPPVTPEDTPARIDDVAGLAGLGPQPGHQRGVGALRHKADVLAVGLLGDRQREIPPQGAGFVLGEAPQWKAQEAELRPPPGACDQGYTPYWAVYNGSRFKGFFSILDFLKI